MNKQFTILLATVLIFVGGAVYWAFSAAPPPEPDAPPETEPPAALTYHGNTLSEEKDGKKVWELTADVIELDANANRTILKGVRGTFYQENGESLTLRAPEAVYEIEEKNIAMTGGATAVSSDGAELTADRMLWEGAAEKFSGEGNVRLTRGDTLLVGDKIESGDGFERVIVTGNARIVKGGAKS